MLTRVEAALAVDAWVAEALERADAETTMVAFLWREWDRRCGEVSWSRRAVSVIPSIAVSY